MPVHAYEANTFVWGAGCIDELSTRLDEVGATHVLVVCGEHVGANDDLFEAVERALGDHSTTRFTGARSDVPLETVMEGVRVKRDCRADVLVSVGGGSASDTAKAIATFDAEEGRSMDEMKAQTTDDGEAYVPALPAEKAAVFAIATTLSAAEVSNAFGVTDLERGEKGVLVDEKVRPVASFYDPELTATTPPSIIASTGMNALDHAVEILYSDPRGENPFYQATAARAIELLMAHLSDAVADPDDQTALEGAQVGAALSALGLIGGICINHGINHALCARHPVSHGDGNSILLPHGIAFNMPAVPERVRRIAAAMDIDTEGRDDQWVVRRVIESVRDLQTEIDVPYRLRDVDVDRDDFDELAAVAATDSAMASNPRPVTEADIRDVLDAAW
ncbi:iron-containing alcohol dehydrogenase family protein [Halomarina ordinaria]|uniref:Iron-containing alcohol dehydrogenase family protein n=1 Tax=Halomarina ordinaria TaxID=3033939 RepID=A0ABD5UDJ2_9EURY|nr:iron-containing alcohol dehydrogenase family protein [Halomarina sp. PSRA2]